MSTDERTRPCMVCLKPSTMRCSACSGEKEAFCSHEHHKLAWPVHRTLCQSSTAACYFPPLSEKEQKLFLQIDLQHETYCLTSWPMSMYSRMQIGFITLGTYVNKHGLWQGDWPSLLKQLGTTSSPLPDPQRSHLLALVRCYALLNAYEAAPAALRPWYQLSAFHTGLVATLYEQTMMSNSMFSEEDKKNHPEDLVPSSWLFDHFAGAALFYRALLIFYHLTSINSPSVTADILLGQWESIHSTLSTSSRFAEKHRSCGYETDPMHEIAVEHIEERFKKDLGWTLNQALEKIGRKDLCVELEDLRSKFSDDDE